MEFTILEKNVLQTFQAGQQQRVLIARALCATKKIIILDEPTNGLDPSIAKQIYKLLDSLKKKENLTIVMVSHDIERAIGYADKIVELTNGKITYEGEPSNYKVGGAM